MPPRNKGSKGYRVTKKRKTNTYSPKNDRPDAPPAGACAEEGEGRNTARRGHSPPSLSCLPDELVALAMSFVLTKTHQWRELSLVCRQFQRCCLLPDAHENMTLVMGAASVGREVAAMTRSLSGLRVIDAGGLMIDTNLLAIAELKLLQSLNLSRCRQVTDAGLVSVAQLNFLHTLNLSGCHKITDAGMGSVAQLTSLHTLNLSRCDQITDAGMRSVAHLTSLQSLDLSWCNRITDAGLASVAQLTSLHTLNLWNCDRITDAGMLSIAQLTSLHNLDITCLDGITDIGLRHLYQLTSLQTLDLRCCKGVTPDGVDQLKEHCQTLEIRQ